MLRYSDTDVQAAIAATLWHPTSTMRLPLLVVVLIVGWLRGWQLPGWCSLCVKLQRKSVSGAGAGVLDTSLSTGTTTEDRTWALAWLALVAPSILGCACGIFIGWSLTLLDARIAHAEVPGGIPRALPMCVSFFGSLDLHKRCYIHLNIRFRGQGARRAPGAGHPFMRGVLQHGGCGGCGRATQRQRGELGGVGGSVRAGGDVLGARRRNAVWVRADGRVKESLQAREWGPDLARLQFSVIIIIYLSWHSVAMVACLDACACCLANFARALTCGFSSLRIFLATK